jgi:hypothetical protein
MSRPQCNLAWRDKESTVPNIGSNQNSWERIGAHWLRVGLRWTLGRVECSTKMPAANLQILGPMLAAKQEMQGSPRPQLRLSPLIRLLSRPQTWGHQHLSLNSHRRGIPVRSIDRFDTRTVGENGHEMSQGETSPAPPQKVPADPPVLLPPRSGTAVKNVDRDTQSLVMGGGGKRGEGLHGMLRAEGGGAKALLQLQRAALAPHSAHLLFAHARSSLHPSAP